jgi:serine/threonine-protein phosphatase 2A regulatory subunit A
MALDFNPLEFFLEEIRNDTANIKIGAVNKVEMIASALGPQKTVSDLIPALSSCITEERFANDEEFLFSLAKQFATLSDYTGGNQKLLIPPLELLAAQEETVIRDQAVQSLCAIVERHRDPNQIVQDDIVDTLCRLSTKTDFFTARVSACALFPCTYKYANTEQKEQLRKLYATICADDTPMVRRAAAHKMKDIFEVCQKQDVLEDFIGVYKALSEEDTQDTIRVACVHTTLVLAKMFTAEENRLHTVKVVRGATEDRSWRVRLTVAKSFPDMCKSFGTDITQTDLLECIRALMRDQEHEVRKEAVKSIDCCLNNSSNEKWNLTSDQLKEYIIPIFQSNTVADSMQQVRAALASVIGNVAKTVGRDVTQRQLLPMISDLMKDEYHDVRLSIVSQSGIICDVLGVDGLIHSLLHSIQSLIMDNHWRIRQSVVEQVPFLAKLFGVDMYQSKLEALFLSSLRDSVHHVRATAINCIEEIAVSFGSKWVVDRLFPKISEQYSQSAGYANRVTTLQVLPKLATVMRPEEVNDLILPIITKAFKDGVPNVRFCSLRMLLALLQKNRLPKSSITGIKSTLADLQTDSDADVQFYAYQVQKACN